MVFLFQPFLSVVVHFEAVRGLFDDPTCFGTCVSIWRLVRALYSATYLIESAGHIWGSDSKLLATQWPVAFTFPDSTVL